MQWWAGMARDTRRWVGSLSLLPVVVHRYRRLVLAVTAVLTVVVVIFLVALFQASNSDDIARLAAYATFFGAVTTLVATLLIVILTARNVEATAELVTESRDARFAQSRPQVLLSFERDKDDALALVVGHFGGGPAQNVRFMFAPTLINEDGMDIGAEPPFSAGIPLVVPGYRQRIQFGNFAEYQTKWLFGNRPDGINQTAGKFAATIKLNDPLANNTEYTNTYVLDLEHLFEFNLPQWERIT
jgi:hypothetical protein